MRIALISDIHGNYPALLAVLCDIAREQCDRIVCLGDLVDGGAQSIEVVRLIRERGILAVLGNHDEFPNTELPPAEAEYLRSLPESLVDGAVIYTHTSPRDKSKKDKINNEIEAWNVFEDKAAQAYRRIFVGDLHVPLIYGQKNAVKFSATLYPVVYDAPFQFAADDRYIVCVGAVGYSRDRYDWSRYAIFDDERDTIEFKAPVETGLKF